MTLTDEQRKKKNEDAKKYYAKYREQIREKYSTDEWKEHRRTVAELRRRSDGTPSREEWLKSVKVTDAIKKERKAHYERLRYLKNKEKILSQQKEYYYKKTGTQPGTLTRDQILERKRLRELERRRKLGVKPRTKMSDDERRARKREYMKRYLRKKD